ncbi:hypothetical protein EGH21_02075 [Halomicroarcula sp. F13]|uniref:Uncharacterized protein n=1 Tax=Haloarcula rubra TaxID=2487747 RepID=A0AAW4PM19_9EURY|nr:hypothetical protein [Halomicroarcula rubra]MBX0321811.1 hypothetical protein [Halomicroarcula rubra]
MVPTDGTTRRRFLAVVGASALAGCGAIEDFGGDERTTIRSHELPDVDHEAGPRRRVAPAVPVAIDGAYLGAARDRTTDLLAALPTPLGPDEIPNGYVRERLLDASTNASDALDEARRAETAFASMQELRRAREHARYAAAGWRFVDAGQSVASLREEHETATAAARSMRSAYDHLGADPVRAALVHARVERALERAADGEQPRAPDDGSALLTVAEWGEETESTRALLEDARHLDSQFRASLPSDAGTVEPRLRRTAETLLSTAESRLSTLPPEPTADDWGTVERVVSDLRYEAEDGLARVAEAPGPATAVVDATGRLAHFDALDRVQDRVESGDRFRVESAADVHQYRETALDALASALADSPAPGLARTILTDAAGRVWSADWELSRARGETTPEQLSDPVASYVVATALARAAPTASRRTADTLASA